MLSRNGQPAQASTGALEPMNSTPLADLALRLRQFAAERDWEQFHTPKNLATALVAEAGELAAEFQWLTAAQSSAPTPEQLERIRAESADVLIYLVRLADKLGFDLLTAATAKIAANERRYPADKVRGSVKKYDQY
jgi:dCTP diphosphatase